MKVLRVRATGSGRVVDWRKLKAGVLEDKSRLAGVLLTTVLTDVVTDLVAHCQSLDPACRIRMLIPNGFFSASFDLAIVGKGFTVTCGRRLVRGFFPINPVAAEFGANYDVVVSLHADSKEAEQALADSLTSKYLCAVIT